MQLFLCANASSRMNFGRTIGRKAKITKITTTNIFTLFCLISYRFTGLLRPFSPVSV